MSAELNGAVATETATENGAPVIPGREEVLKSFAAEVLKASGAEPEPKVADPKATLPAEGEKPKNDLSKTGEQKTDDAGAVPAAEPEWSADKLAWFEQRAAAQTPEEIAAIDAATPEFDAAEMAWLKAQEVQSPESQVQSEDDHLADDAELKGKLDEATQERINKRIGKEVAKTKEAKEKYEQALVEVEELKGKLAAKPVSAAMPAAGPLAEVVDAAGVQKVVADAESALDLAEDLLTRLDDEPAAVEAQLRELKIELKGEDGSEDYSPTAMTKFLKSVKQNADRTLRRELPKRVEFLKQTDAYATEAMSRVPAIRDPKSDLRKTFNTVLQQAPWLKNQPHWPRTAAIWALGTEAYMKLAPAGKPAAKTKRPIPTVIPSPRGQPPAAPRVKPNAVTDDVMNSALSGNKKDRLKYIQTLVPK